MTWLTMDLAGAAPTPGAMDAARPVAVTVTGPALRRGVAPQLGVAPPLDVALRRGVVLRLDAVLRPGVVARGTAPADRVPPDRAPPAVALSPAGPLPSAAAPVAQALVQTDSGPRALGRTAGAPMDARPPALTPRVAPTAPVGVIEPPASRVTGSPALTNAPVVDRSVSAPRTTVQTLLVPHVAVTAGDRRAAGLPVLTTPDPHARILGSSTVHRPLCEVLAMSPGVRRPLIGRRQAPALSALPVRPPIGGNQAVQAPHAKAIAEHPVRVVMPVLVVGTPVRVVMLVLVVGTPVRVVMLVLVVGIREPAAAVTAESVATAVRRAPEAGAGIQPVSTAALGTAVPSVQSATAPTAVAVRQPAQALSGATRVPTALAAVAAIGSRRTTSRPGAPGRPEAPRSRFHPAPIRSCSTHRFAQSCARSANSPRNS
jgi:hypothetical protein